MHGLMTSYVAANMPDGFTDEDVLKTVSKQDTTGGTGSWTVSETEDSIWLMSYSELTGTAQEYAGSEGSQYAWFNGKVTNSTSANTAIANLYKTRDGSTPKNGYTYAWLRSPYLTQSGSFLDVTSSGNPGSLAGANYCLGVCPAFAM